MIVNKDSGSIKEVFYIALPMVISFACDTVMTFTDRLFLSKLGPEYMNAAMAGGIACFLMMTFFVGLLGYITAFVAQNFGANKLENCSLAVTQGIFLAVGGYIVILGLTPLFLFVFDKLHIDTHQLVLQKQYFNILLYSVFFGLLRNAVGGFFSGIGKTNILMLISIITMILNGILNYLLIFGNFGFPRMGINGSGTATAISAFVGVAILFFLYFRKNNVETYKIKESFKFNKHIFKTIFYFGFPSGLELFLSFFAFNVLVFIFHSQGAAIATAATIMFNWDMVAFVPLLGFSIAVTSLVGRYIGANRSDLVKKVVSSGLKLAVCYSFVIFMVFVFFTKALVLVFKPDIANNIFDKEVFPVALIIIKLASVYVLTDSQMIIFSAALRGAGDTLFSMIISICVHWSICVVGFIMMKMLGMETIQSWIIMVIIFAILSSLFYFRYRTDKWMNIKKIL